MPATVKTAISLRQELLRQGEALAGQMHISRSRLFALALEEFIRQHENRRILDRLNSVYSDNPDASERRVLDDMLRQQRRLVRRSR